MNKPDFLSQLARKVTFATVLSTSLAVAAIPAQAAEYVMDTAKAHAFIQFKVSHLGYSWLLGRFNRFSGEFSYDEDKPGAATVNVEIDTASVDSNHAERDKHLRGDAFLNVTKFPKASFRSTAFRELGDGKAELIGEFTLRGVTRPLTIAVDHIGHGKDPWGGHRRGFQGSARFALADYGIVKNLGPASKEVELYLSIEGIRQ